MSERIMPDVPLSIELRSSASMTRYPDPPDRARAAAAACAPLLASR